MRREKKAKAEGVVIITLVTMMVLMLSVSVLASELEPTGPPSEGAMKTLDEIYDAIVDRCAMQGGVPKTGQTKCYADNGTEISCSGTGQDGELQNGVSWPIPRFTDNGDGTVTDNLTGLIWLKNANCFGTRTWANSLTDCNTLNSGECGLTDGSIDGDWRLPNLFELESLRDMSNFNPVLPTGHPFTTVMSIYYWSSTTYATSTVYAWYMHMVIGSVSGGGKSNYFYVWPVRGGNG